jgi:glycine betaine/proline transport system substrate-binding protein
VRAGYLDECPNLGQLLKNLKFTAEMETQIMVAINGGADPEDAASAWLKDNPEVLDGWLEGVTTFEGEPGLPAVQEHLGTS